MNKEIATKGSISIIGAWIGDKLGIICPALLLLCILMIIDYISGMLASKKEALEHPENKKYGWSSQKSIIGVYKKIGYILIIIVAASIDYLLFEFAEEMNINFITKTVFGLLVTVWLIINELISVLENAGRMGVVLPQFIANVLTELKKEIEDKD